jgi:tRNA U34 5-methylaminomethyl-2-thiouridine-forming methyltransferase MnmC
MHRQTQPDLDWKDGVIPVARAFDDPYFSLAGGLAETSMAGDLRRGLPVR